MVAVNIYGSGITYSVPTSYQTGQIPNTPSAPSTSITGIYIVIAWTNPFNNYYPITSYQVLV